MASSYNPRLRYHAVTVVATARACPAARAIKDVRLLSLEAPRLPVAGCDSPAACECRFQHYSDRRTVSRREPEGTAALRRAFLAPERRNRRGRREADFVDDDL